MAHMGHAMDTARVLIRDNDSKYGQCFTRVAQDRQSEVTQDPVRAPKANAICERFVVV